MAITVETSKPGESQSARRRHRSHSDESDEESDGEKMSSEVNKNGSVTPPLKTGGIEPIAEDTK